MQKETSDQHINENVEENIDANLSKNIDEKDLNGIIYKITNKATNKVYIGKTKEYYGDKKFGAENRLKVHISSALKKHGCPLLGSSIRKHGKENFVMEKLFNCSIDEVDEREIATIKEYDSANPEKGYNIALGGKGRSVVHVPDSAREKISAAGKGDDSQEMNIQPVKRDNVLVGYNVQRKEKGKKYVKWFSSTENTPEQNLALAKKWLYDMKNNDIRLNTKKTKLPSNINYARNKENEIVGYQVNLMRDAIKYNRGFIDSKYTMEQKFEQAVKYREDILAGKVVEKSDKNMMHDNLPKNVNIYKNKNGDVIGYVGKIVVDKVAKKKLFIKLSVPMEEKLKQATEYVKSLLDTQ